MTPPAETKKRWSLYVLECNDGTLYTGITNDLSRRLAQHNSGKASRYTRTRLPVKLVHAQRCRGRSHALKREHALKQLPRSEKVAFIHRKRCITGSSVVPAPPPSDAERVKRGTGPQDDAKTSPAEGRD